ncbi:hypothetical protein CBQ28_23075 [Pseudoalteromonas sp. GCY]|uniref:hypothetical protein n=1 Tax=Pseudoalteromonas sp. GCY TaxID=2003316 RepID=UPI000BFEDD02|nr:hypothetical protein [Pseudoalteromonas sp. GCY]PHI34753.1 hypothetical protein CBQ28_23075 [Pseudoalteromonas sp. GCY]QQQ67918.1 hypothetical protein JJQ94_08930 [Pseudoalteromonas sp. GCY]
MAESGKLSLDDKLGVYFDNVPSFHYYPEKDAFIFFATNNRDDYPEQLMAALDDIVIGVN